MSRWRVHRNKLRTNTHSNKHLQCAWNKYGESNFIFEIVENTTKDVLLDKEQLWLDKYAGRPECYNIGIDAACAARGKKLSAAHIASIKASIIGVPRTKQIRQQISNMLKGRSILWRDKISKTLSGRGHKLTADMVRKIRQKFATNEYSQAALAREYDVGPTIIHHIVNRTKWNSVN